MPRHARFVEAGRVYHVLNRGNGRQALFRKPEDFEAFERILAEGLERYPVDLLAWCLMGNHWHLVLRPRKAEALSRLLGWVGVTHVRRHHAHHRTVGGGHLYQGRFKSFVVQDDSHFLMLCRYVEGNPLRAKQVERAEDWPYSSLTVGREGEPALSASAWPVRKPAGWVETVNAVMPQEDLDRVRMCIQRDRPLGGERWTAKTAAAHGLEYTLRPRGRPRKQ